MENFLPILFNNHRADLVPSLHFGPTFPEHIRAVMLADCLTNSFEWSDPPPSHLSWLCTHLVKSHFVCVPRPLTVKEVTNGHYYGKKVTFIHGSRRWGGAPAAAPSLSGKLMIRYHKTQDGHVKMEWPPAEFPSAAVCPRSAFILILHPLALILLYTCKNTSNTRSFCRFISGRICSHDSNE